MIYNDDCYSSDVVVVVAAAAVDSFDNYNYLVSHQRCVVVERSARHYLENCRPYPYHFYHFAAGAGFWLLQLSQPCDREEPEPEMSRTNMLSADALQ